MERYWQIEKINLKYHVFIHVLVCAALLGLSPFLMGVKNLTAVDTAKVLERYAALIGIIMLPPIFLPEQDKDIRELVYADDKYKGTPANLASKRLLEASGVRMIPYRKNGRKITLEV